MPMGMSIRDIIYKIGGEIPGGKKFKAVQTGGPSGRCLPEEYWTCKSVLTNSGQGQIGFGGMIVMDEDTCSRCCQVSSSTSYRRIMRNVCLAERYQANA